MRLAYVSWKNLWNKPLSAILSLVLIAFGVGLLSLLVIFQNQFEEQFERNQAGVDLVVGAKGSPLQLILSSMFHVDAPTGNVQIDDVKFLFNPKNPYIKDAIPLSIGDSYKTFRIIGTSVGIRDFYPAELAVGKWWEAGMEVTIGAQVAAETGLQVGDNFFSSHGFNSGDLEHDEGEKFVVAGVLKGHGSVIDNLILCRSEAIWEVHEGHNHENEHDGHDHDASDSLHVHQPLDSLSLASKTGTILDYPEKSITSVLVRFMPDKKRALPVINMPRNINENTPVMATAPAYELNKLLANAGVFLNTLRYLAYLIALISAASIFISLYNNLRARKQELGMMRVVGAKPAQLFALIIMEAIIVGVIGAVIGLVLAHVAVSFISTLLSSQFHYGIDYMSIYSEEIYIFVGTIVLAFVAGLIPAWKAYKTNIIRSIR